MPVHAPDDIVQYACAPISETPSGWCGFDEAPRITIDHGSTTSQGACALLQTYVDTIGPCAPRSAAHVDVEVHVAAGHVSAIARGATPAVDRCIEEHAYRLGAFGGDFHMDLSVEIARPHSMASGDE
jgi:hypothetical protein